MSALQRELNVFFSKIQGCDYNIQAVTKGAFTQARSKLKPEAFKELNQIVVEDFYEVAEYRIWGTHRVLAIDGSTINLPTHTTTINEFGQHAVGCKADVMRSMARISLCYDVLNLLTLDACIDRYDISEQTLLKRHLEQVSFHTGDLLLLDRGYASIALMYTLQKRGVDFCMRMKANWWKKVRAFNESGLESAEVVFKLPLKDSHLLNTHASADRTVRCRLVAITLDTGEKEILCTSLLDQSTYTIAELKKLYHLRWNVEEAFKLLKCRISLESFSGKTANAVRQDFYAKIFMMTLCAAISFPIEKQLRQEHEQSKQKNALQVNRTNALAFLRESWVAFWFKRKRRQAIASMDNILLKTAEAVRKGRKFERKKTPKKPPSMNYKPL